MLPGFGILAFIGLFIYASFLYPGGSQADLNSIGFDWANNYWCNLTNKKGMNGLENPARPLAIFAMLILCSSLLLFFFQFTRHFVKNKFWKTIINVSGVLSMITAALIFTDFHDLMTILSSIFGIVVVVGIIRTVYQSKFIVFKVSGVACIILLAANNIIYYTGNQIEYLPLIQKITFAFVLIWIMGLNFKMLNNPELPYDE